MKKNNLTQELAVSEHLHLSTAVKAVDGTMRIIKEALVHGESVVLRGFGRFALEYREARQVHHFGTGEMMTMPGRTIVKFYPSKELKDSLAAMDKKHYTNTDNKE